MSVFPTITVALLAALSLPAAAQLTPALELEIDEAFPALGSTISFTVTGPPGAFFGVQGGALPAELALGAPGTLYLKPGLLVDLGTGALDAGGQGALVATVPVNPTLDDKLFHFQAGAFSAGEFGFSNSVTVRFGTAPVSGVRNPESVAITPDGLFAMVAHQEDGSVSLIDVAAPALVRDVAVGPRPVGKGLPVSVEIDPDGRHAFVANPWTSELAVLDAASASMVARLAVPRATRDVAFDFTGADIVYATNERDSVILAWVEAAAGVFVPVTPIDLQGSGAGPLAVAGDGRLVIGHRTSLELEIVDPTLPAGSTTLLRAPLGRVPYDVEVVGSEAWIATFNIAVPGDGRNELLRVNMDTGAILGSHFHDHGTDYLDLEIEGSRVALVGAGSGSVVLGDATTFAFQGISDLAPFQPLATPQDGVFVPNGGDPDELLVVNYFRDSVSVVDVTGAGPFPVTTEIPLHPSGVPQVPLAFLTQEDDGDWWFRSVQFYNGTPQVPNPVSCATCHPFGAGSDALTHPAKQAMPLFDAGATGPYGSSGFNPSLLAAIQGTFGAHGKVGGSLPFEADVDILAYLQNAAPPPPSPYLEPGGSLSPAAQAGKVVFEGTAGCAICHEAPLFIPGAGSPKTIVGGVGTGLSPANVPSLRGAWSTAPYFHNHSATTLLDVLLQNPGDQHGTTSALTPDQQSDLVEYVRSL